MKTQTNQLECTSGCSQLASNDSTSRGKCLWTKRRNWNDLNLFWPETCRNWQREQNHRLPAGWWKRKEQWHACGTQSGRRRDDAAKINSAHLDYHKSFFVKPNFSYNLKIEIEDLLPIKPTSLCERVEACLLLDPVICRTAVFKKRRIRTWKNEISPEKV